MKRGIAYLFILLLFTNSFIFAELNTMKIQGEPILLDSEITGKRDADGKLCAAIKVVSDMKGLSYDSNDGIVDVKSRPSEDIVYISFDERVLTIYNTGYHPKKIILSEEGINLYEGATWQITLVSNKVPSFSSSQNIGRLAVDIKPDYANGYFEIEGMPFTGKSGFNAEFPVGNWTLKFKSNNNYFETKSRTITVREDRTTRVTVELEDISGYLDIMVNTIPVKIYINNEYDKALSEDFRKRLKPGVYNIKVTKPNYRTVYKTVKIKKGKVNKIDINLTRSTGDLDLTVSPIYSDVKLKKDGKLIRTWQGSNKIIDLPVGMYELFIKADNYRSETKTINITPNESTSVLIQLESRQETIVRSNSTNRDSHISNSYKYTDDEKWLMFGDPKDPMSNPGKSAAVLNLLPGLGTAGLLIRQNKSLPYKYLTFFNLVFSTSYYIINSNIDKYNFTSGDTYMAHLSISFLAGHLADKAAINHDRTLASNISNNVPVLLSVGNKNISLSLSYSF